MGRQNDVVLASLITQLDKVNGNDQTGPKNTTYGAKGNRNKHKGPN